MTDEPGHEYTDHLTATDIVTTKDIAERLGVKHNTVFQWGWRGLLPAPDLKTDPPLWRWSTIKQWAYDTGRIRPERSEMDGLR